MTKMGFPEPTGNKMDVYITAESTITGDLQTKSNIKVDGKVTGSVTATGDVHIGSNAIVEGHITGMDVQIAGYVNGNINASGGLLLYGSARLSGDVKAISIEVEKGAIYKGSKVEIGETIKAVEKQEAPAVIAEKEEAPAFEASEKKETVGSEDWATAATMDSKKVSPLVSKTKAAIGKK
jgi:cytoskeletal protein CcmA (bactofilin family)